MTHSHKTALYEFGAVIAGVLVLYYVFTQVLASIPATGTGIPASAPDVPLSVAQAAQQTLQNVLNAVNPQPATPSAAPTTGENHVATIAASVGASPLVPGVTPWEIIVHSPVSGNSRTVIWGGKDAAGPYLSAAGDSLVAQGAYGSLLEFGG